MCKPKSVVIDGTIYVPVLQAVPGLKDFTKALLCLFWNDEDLKTRAIEDLMEAVTIRIEQRNIDPFERGMPFQEALAEMVKFMEKEEAEKKDWRDVHGFYKATSSNAKCRICGSKEKIGSEPRFGYLVCEQHKDVPPSQMPPHFEKY